MKSQALYPSIAVLIIHLFNRTPRAKREVLKTPKMHVQLEILHLRFFFFFFLLLTNHLLNVSLRRKTDITIIARRITTGESKSRGSATARYWYTTDKPFVPRRFTDIGPRMTNVAVYNKEY